MNTYASLMVHSARIALTHYARATLAERAKRVRRLDDGGADDVRLTDYH